MLLLVAACSALATCFYLIGGAALSLLGATPRPRGRTVEYRVLATWVGLLAVAQALALASLVGPLSAGVGAGVLVGLCAAALAYRREPGAAPLGSGDSWEAGRALLVLAGAAALGSKPVTWFDTGLYHAGAVRWLHEHGAVTGLALLHSRFGFASSWFALGAPLDAAALGARGFTVPSTLAVALFVLLLVGAARRILLGSGGVAERLLLWASLPVLPLALWMGASASPDLPVLVLTLMVAWLWAGGGERVGLEGREHVPALVLAWGALAVKLSALPLAAVAAAVALRRTAGEPGAGLRLLLAAAAFAVPLLLLGRRLSGCLLYPIAATCLDVPWGVGPAAAAREASVVTAWARWAGPPPPVAAPPWEWLALWPLRTPLHVGTTLVLAGSVLATALLLLRWRSHPPQGGLRATLLLAWVGGTFAFQGAPSPRFLLSWAALPLALAAAGAGGPPEPEGSAPAGRPRTRAAAGVAPAAALALVAAAAVLTLRSETLQGRFGAGQLLLPPPLESPPVVRRSAGEVGYWVRADGDDRCWAAPLPCLPAAGPAPARLRDPSAGLRSGLVRAGP